MFCSRCGRKADSEDQFCGWCGLTLPWVGARIATPGRATHNEARRIAIIAVPLLVVLFTVVPVILDLAPEGKPVVLEQKKEPIASAPPPAVATPDPPIFSDAIPSLEQKPVVYELGQNVSVGYWVYVCNRASWMPFIGDGFMCSGSA